jgi:hypothetical protein
LSYRNSLASAYNARIQAYILRRGPGIPRNTQQVGVVLLWSRLRLHRFLRCLPVGIFTEDLVPLWIHPAAPAFGLIECEWPRQQVHRELGESKDWSAWAPVIPADIEDPVTGLPTWYARSHTWPSTIRRASLERHGALLNAYGALLHRLGEVDSRAKGFLRAHQEFRNAWSRFFTPGKFSDSEYPTAA